MQTTDKATTKQRTQWQDSEAQHALTTAFDKKIFKNTNITSIFRAVSSANCHARFSHSK